MNKSLVYLHYGVYDNSAVDLLSISFKSARRKAKSLGDKEKEAFWKGYNDSKDCLDSKTAEGWDIISGIIEAFSDMVSAPYYNPQPKIKKHVMQALTKPFESVRGSNLSCHRSRKR